MTDFQTDPVEMDGENGANNIDGHENSEDVVEAFDESAMETMDDGDDKGNDDEDSRKLFVGGLSWETTAKDLREYFSKFGEVEHCNLKTDPVTKRSRGFGFVLFKEEATVDKALLEKEHKLHGRNIDPKRANPREPIKKVFVRNLDQNLTENEIREYFGKFGKITKLELPFDKMRNQRRNYCFIEFESEEAVDKICENAGHQIGSREAQEEEAGTKVVGIRAITKTITIIITKATVDMVAMATGVIMDRIMDMDMDMIMVDGAAMDKIKVNKLAAILAKLQRCRMGSYQPVENLSLCTVIKHLIMLS
ncbi:HNRNPABD [Acanthosepion pharaonis]|uniref:HNRNPABD n=1 Tax=Acanthosepion pharaonis TaxID=158019 RepID=A0A812EBL8_ACAPH|nr:HNRNPABD [Sepia pharaonis]